MHLSGELLGYILWAVFGLVLFSTFLAGLIGFMKGLFKTSLKTVLKAILIVIFLFVTPSLSNALGNIPFVPYQGNKVTLQFFIADYITSTGLVSPINGLSIYETAIMISNAVISYAVFFILMILTQILISILTTIVYHGIFRWFAPVETRKDYKARKKNRKKAAATAALVDENGEITKEEHPKKKLPLLPWCGLSLGAVQEFVFVITLISPITALSRIAIRNEEGISSVCETTGVDETKKEQLLEYFHVIDGSAISKIAGIGNYDTLLMNKAGAVMISGTEVSLSGLTDSLFDIATPLLKDGTISYDMAAGQVTINYAALLSVTSIDSLVESLLGNSQLMALIPPLVDVALNAVSNSGINVDAIDLNNIDWSNDLSALKEIYSAVYTDAVKPLISEDGYQITPNHFFLATSTMSDEKLETISQALGKLGEMESVTKNLPTVLANLGSLMENRGLDILPTESSDYLDIQWSEELPLYVSSLFRCLRTLGMDLSSSFNVNQLLDQFYASLGDDTKRQELEEQIVGSSTSKGLLDSQLMGKISLGDVVQSSLSSVVSLRDYVQNVDFKEAFAGLDQEGIKKEFHTLFLISGSVFKEDSKLNITKLKTIDIGDSETCSQLADLLKTASSSVLFTKLYPSIMKNLLFNSSIDFTKFLYGLTPYSFNYEAEDFVDDFRDVLLLLPNVDKLYKNLDDKTKNTAEKLNDLDVDTIRNLLNIIVNSDFLNSDLETGTTSEALKSINIHTVLTNLFQNEVFRDLKLKAPSLMDLQEVYWGEGLEEDGGEIYNICAFIEDAKTNASFLVSADKNLDAVLDPDAVGDLIYHGMDSKILEPSILEIIDSSLNQYFVKLGLPFNIQEMRDTEWKEDSDEIADILALLQGVNLDDIDFRQLSENHLLNSLLTTISKTNLVHTIHSSDPVGYLAYEFMGNKDIYQQLDIPVLPSSDFIAADPSSPSEFEPRWQGDTQIVTMTLGPSDHRYERDMTITTDGTIEALCSVLGKWFETMVTEEKIPVGFVDKLDHELHDPLVRALIGNLLENAVNCIELEGESASYASFLTAIDFRQLKYDTEEEAKSELKLFERLSDLSTTKYQDTESTVLSTIFSDFFSLNTKFIEENGESVSLEEVFDDLMDRFAVSKSMTTTKSGYGLSPLALLMKSAIGEAGLKEKVVLNQNGMDAQLNGIVGGIADWESEMDHFKRIVNRMQGKDLSTFDFSSSGFTVDSASEIMEEMNASVLFHFVPIHFIEDAFESAHIEDYCKDPETGVAHARINYKTHLSTSQKDVDYWNHEIHHVAELAFGENGLKDIFSSGSSLSTINLTTINIKFLYHLGSLDLLQENRSYIVYNLMKENISLDMKEVFQDASVDYQDQNRNVMRLEELFFANPTLLNAEGELDETKALADLDQVNSVIHLMVEHIDEFATMGLDDFKNTEFDFEALNDSCYGLDGGNLVRSEFASELVASMEKQLLTNPNLSMVFGEASSAIDFYQNGHALINSLEGRAFNGLLLLSKKELQVGLISGTPVGYYTKTDLLDVMDLLGNRNSSSLTEVCSYFFSQSGYESGNSMLARNLKAASSTEPKPLLVLSLPVLNQESLVPVQVKLGDLISSSQLDSASLYDLVDGLKNIA